MYRLRPSTSLFSKPLNDDCMSEWSEDEGPSTDVSELTENGVDEFSIYCSEPLAHKSVRAFYYFILWIDIANLLLFQTNVLLYWKANQHRFPALSVMARRYLAIPATTATVRSVVEATESILHKSGTGMSPSELKQITCVKSWGLESREDSGTERKRHAGDSNAIEDIV